MLFPNHPDFQEIRPGMGYAPGARNFGYALGARNFGDVAHIGYAAGARNFDTTNYYHMGEVAHMGYAPGARGMGDISASMKNLAVDDGIAPNDIDLLDSLGATDQDMTDLINGNVSLTALYAKYGVSIPSSSTATAAAQPTITPRGPTAAQAFGSAGQLPTGSKISYVAGWSPIHGNADSGAVQAALAQELPQHGMQLLSYSATGASILGMGTTGFNATIAITGAGFALVSDAQSILVAIVQSVIGTGNLTTSQANLISTPSTPATATPAAASDPLAWLEGNALYIGLGIGALVLLNNFTGRKRR